MAVVANKTSTPTNDRSLRQGIAEFLDYNSNPDNPPIMMGANLTPVMKLIMDAVLGSRKTDLPSRATTPKKNELGASRQPGGYIVTDSTEDARTYAKLGSGLDVDPDYGQFYDVMVNPEGIRDVRDLPKGALETLRMIKGPGTLDYRAKADQRVASDILNFLDIPSTMFFPKLYPKSIADALHKEGIGGLLFKLQGGTGLMPEPTRGIISYRKPVYLTPLAKTQNIKRQQEAAAEILKPELSPEELLKRSRESRQRLLDENTPIYKHRKILKLKEADEVLKGERKVSNKKYKELKKFMDLNKDKFDPEK
jgi:hypothetical protein